MYKDCLFIDYDAIKALDIKPKEYYFWAEEVLKTASSCILPTKTRIPLKESDYFNVMPCVIPNEDVLGLKVVTRSENRRDHNGKNIDGDILLYRYDDFSLYALIDGAYITTVRTAAVAVYSMMRIAQKRKIIAMVGLGNIGTAIGDILFDIMSNEVFTVKLFRYKGQAEIFASRYKNKKNVHFIYCDSYEELMKDSDVVFSSITYAEKDFCPASCYKDGVTVIPVHLRGFMDCDLHFDHIVTSDLESIKKFRYYDQFKRLSLINNLLAGTAGPIRNQDSDRILVYNLGLATYDLFFANKITKLIQNDKA